MEKKYDGLSSYYNAYINAPKSQVQVKAVWALGVLSFALCVMFSIDSVKRVRAQGSFGAGA